MRTRLKRAFADRGYDVRDAENGEAAIRAAQEDSPEYALVDLRMPGGLSGLDVVRELKAIDPGTNVVVLTGFGSIANALDAVRLGATHYLAKPADADDVLAAFARAGWSGEGAVSIDHPVPTLARAEWEHINRVLADCGGNISKAARLLGLARRSLQRKLAKYPVPR
ncbi:MAG TPA: response regulator [Myxococcaceae bacterium]|nr:response regulator [Myxococcaceae bacterium]